jgi:transcriptional regulator with XRE-family HTH domain
LQEIVKLVYVLNIELDLEEIAMEGFDSRYQEHMNGPLTKDLRDRLQRFRNEQGSTLKDIGDRLGFSGAFISTLLNPKSPAHIRTKHIPKMVLAIEHAEIESGWRKPGLGKPVSDLSLEELIKAISSKGFDVTIKPRV